MSKRFQYADELVVQNRQDRFMKVIFHSYVDEQIVQPEQITLDRMWGLPEMNQHIDCYVCRFDKKFRQNCEFDKVDVYPLDSKHLSFDMRRKVITEQISWFALLILMKRERRQRA